MDDDVRAVRLKEERLSESVRTCANDISHLLGLLETQADATPTPAKPKVVLAAMQALRALFAQWASQRELVLKARDADNADGVEYAPPDDAEDPALAAFRRWLRDKYSRFVRALEQAPSWPSPALRAPAVDSLLQMAAVEVRHSKPDGTLHLAALDSPGGALARLASTLARAEAPQAEMTHRLAEKHGASLDVSFYLLRHVQRLAKKALRDETVRAEQLLSLLLLLRPPDADVPAGKAALLVRPAARDGREWPVAARRLLSRRLHMREYANAWRALISLRLNRRAFRCVLAALPDAVLPHVPRPLRFCDLLSDSYSRGGLDAIYALRGLYELISRHNLEYPCFFQQLYALVTASALEGAQRQTFAAHLSLFLNSQGLPAYVAAAFCKRLSRIALLASPCAAALACALVYNVLLAQPTTRLLIHRPADSGDANHAITTDPFDDVAADPHRSRALESSLWELDTLRLHYCPAVSSIAAAFAAPILPTSPPIDLEPLAALSSSALFELEAGRKIKSVALASDRAGHFLPSASATTPLAQQAAAAFECWSATPTSAA